MNRLISAALVVALSTAAIPAVAQDGSAPAPAAAATDAPALMLPAGTQITVANNSEVNSTEHRAGHIFPLTVAQDVRVGDTIVVPRGTRAMAEITWRTGRGSFGKSGKLNFSVRYLDFNGTRVPVIGSFRQEGEGSTMATGGAILLAGLIGGALVTGSRARIPAGRELTVTLADATPFLMGANGAQLDPAFRPRSVEEVATAELARVRNAAEETCRQSAIGQAPGNRRQQDYLTRRCVRQAENRRQT